MPLNTTAGSSEIKIAEAGMWFGRCVVVLDLGTHTDEKFKTDKGKPKRSHMVQIQWEVPDQTTEYEGQQRPMMVTKRYNLSHNEKATLRKDLESWYGQKFDTNSLEQKGGFDVEKLLGRPAMLNLVHSPDGKYCNVASVSPLPKGFSERPQVNELRFFALNDPKADVWETLSQKTRDFIRLSEEVMLGGVELPLDPVKESKPAPSASYASEVPF